VIGRSSDLVEKRVPPDHLITQSQDRLMPN